MAADWYYLDYRRRIGPLDASAMRALIAGRTLSATSMVRRSGETRWVRLSDTELWPAAAPPPRVPVTPRRRAPSRPATPRSSATRRPAFLSFPLLLAATAGLAAAVDAWPTVRPLPFLLVLCAWIVSVCLHEFAHGATAFVFGDTTIPDRGYLTLDPRRFVDPVMSVALPVLALAMGGAALPGGAVRTSASLPSAARSAVALAGPAANAGVLWICAVAFAPLARAHPDLASVLAFFALLQAQALVLNLLPVPGLDGFSAIRPLLAPPFAAACDRLAPLTPWLLFAVLCLPEVGRPLSAALSHAMAGVGLPQDAVARGGVAFAFWRAWPLGQAAVPLAAVTACLAVAKAVEMSRSFGRRREIAGGVALAAIMLAAALFLR